MECLESLSQITYPNYNVIIIDNASHDDSLYMIKKYIESELIVESDFFQYNLKNKPLKLFEYSKTEVKANNNVKKQKSDNNVKKEVETKKDNNTPSNKGVTLIKNDQNYGFAEGNNIGMRYALKNLDPEYILILNNDTVVDKEFLDELIIFGEGNDKVGFLGPKTYYYDYEGDKNVLDFAGGKLNLIKGESVRVGYNEVDKGQYNEPRTVDYIQGSCLLIKSKVLHDVGLFNPKFFTYWEESDLCLRGFKEGYESFYVPNAKIWHKSGVSSVGFNKIFYFTRNMFWFVKKHSTRQEYILFLLYFFGIRFWYFSGVYLVYHHNLKLYKAFLSAVYNGLNEP